MKTIRILGGGPAGLTAGITLARAGVEVVVFERAPDVGSRHEGDLEAVENWTEAEDVVAEFGRWGLTVDFDCHPLHAGTWIGPGFRRVVTLADRQPLMYLVSRGPRPGDLDHALLRQARGEGVRVELNRTGTEDEVDIVASGSVRPRAYGIGYNFRTSAPDGAYVCFDDDLTPKAYSYLALCQGRGTVVAGTMVPRRGMKEALPRAIEGFQSLVEFDIQSPAYFAAGVGLGLPGSASRDGKLFVGEAAGFQDLFAAFGIRMAIATGYLAARSLLTGEDFEVLWQARYGALIRAAAVNRWCLEAAGNRGYSLALGYLDSNASRGRALVSRVYRPQWFTPILWPLARRALADYTYDGGRRARTGEGDMRHRRQTIAFVVRARSEGFEEN